ncbi:MAG: ferrous iron transport protein A [Clostridia bacterium]|nr:ferrous iron transport protein A [Clostridia bacterium]
MTLYETELGKKYEVLSINVSENIKRRIFDIGLTKGSFVTPLFCSFLGEPTAYLIRGAVIALRNDETKKIFVKPIN